MSSLGPISFNGHDEESIWLARQMGEYSRQSEEVASQVDREIRKIVEKAYDEAKKILLENKGALARVSSRLLEKETLTRDEFEALLGD